MHRHARSSQKNHARHDTRGRSIYARPSRCSVQSLLLVGGDGHIAGGVCHAGEDKALAHLVVVQEALVALVNGTGL